MGLKAQELAVQMAETKLLESRLEDRLGGGMVFELDYAREEGKEMHLEMEMEL